MSLIVGINDTFQKLMTLKVCHILINDTKIRPKLVEDDNFKSVMVTLIHLLTKADMTHLGSVMLCIS